MIAPLARHLLLACAIVALGIFALLALTDRSWVAPQPHPVDASTFGAAVVERGLRAPRQLEEIAERPLFSPSRRPPAPPAPPASAQAAAPAEPIQDAKVLGLFGREGAWGVILSIEGKIRRVRAGEKIGRWSLARVEGNQIVFDDGGGGRTTLKIVHLPRTAVPPAENKTAAGGAAAEVQREAPDAVPVPPEQKGQ